MKLTEFMCAAFAAMVAFAGCQKEQDPVENTNLKSVEVKINNVFPSTKAPGLSYNLEGQNVKLNSLQFFFSDGTSLYEAKDAEGNKADVYYDATELSALGGNIKVQFHFLPAAVKKVIVIGNHNEMSNETANFDYELEIGNYQNVENFPLYAEGALSSVPQQDTHGETDESFYTNLYSVSLSVIPHVARFEITSLGCTIPTNSEKIVKVVSIAFADFYDKCGFRSNTLSFLRSVELTQQNIFSYFQTQMNPSKWNNDFFNGMNGQEGAGNSHPVAEFTAANPSMETNIAYNFFCKGATAPLLLLNVIEYENQAALEQNIGTPGYLYTNTYRLNSTEPVISFEPGKIYRMGIKFSVDDLQHQERCLDITVDVAKWVVINVTPEF